MLNILVALLCFFNAFTASAQAQILQKTIDKITNAQNISYEVFNTSNDPFGGSDNKEKIRAIFFNRQKDGNYEKYRVDCDATNGKFRYMGDGRQKIELYFKDSTYIITPAGSSNFVPDPLNIFLKSLKRVINNAKYKTLMLPDSTINKISCYHILLTWQDSSKKSFENTHVFINKTDNMILAERSHIQGEMLKGGISLGIIQMKESLTFSSYKLNVNKYDPKGTSIPTWFKPEQKALPLLSKGTIAPDWELTATNNSTLSLARLKGKVVLIDFTFNGCPACMLTLPSIEKLHKKYDGTDVAIVTINTLDSKEEVLKFMSKNHIKAPIYIKGGVVSKTYHSQAAPNFFVIDKQGVISKSYDGYFENFDTEILTEIESLR